MSYYHGRTLSCIGIPANRFRVLLLSLSGRITLHPYIVIDPGIGQQPSGSLYGQFIGIVAVILPLIWISLQMAYEMSQGTQLESDDPRCYCYLSRWMILHNLSYMCTYLHSTASVYAVMNHIALWLPCSRHLARA